MKVFDLHHNCEVAVAVKSQAITTDKTVTGETIDTAGYEALEFLFLTKTLTDGDYAVTLYEGDAANMTDEAAVSSAELLGGPVAFTDDTDDDAVARIGYIGKKRYVRAKVASTNTTTGLDMFSGLALLAFAHHEPVADQNG